MKRFVLFALVLSLAFAGCFGKKTDDGATPTDNATGTTTPTPGGTGGNTTPGGGTTTLAPKTVCTDSPDFSQAGNPATGAEPPAKACTIDPGYTTLTLIVNVTQQTPAPGAVVQAFDVKVAGLDVQVGQGPVTAATSATKTGAATPGAAKIEYTGGPAVGVTVDVKVVES
jgi:hypothetical protein